MQILITEEVVWLLNSMSMPMEFLMYCTSNKKPDVKQFLKWRDITDRALGELIMNSIDRQEKKRRSGYKAYFSKEIKNYQDRVLPELSEGIPPIVPTRKWRPRKDMSKLQEVIDTVRNIPSERHIEQKMYTDEMPTVKERKQSKKEIKPVEKTSKKIFTMMEDWATHSMWGVNSYPGSLKPYYNPVSSTKNEYGEIETIVENQDIPYDDMPEMKRVLNITKHNYDSLIQVMIERDVPRPDSSIYVIENYMTPPNYVLKKEGITEVTTTFQYLRKHRPHWTKQILIDVNTIDWERKDFWYALTQVKEAQLEEIKEKIINIDDPYMQLVCSYITDIVEYDIAMEIKENGVVTPPAHILALRK